MKKFFVTIVASISLAFPVAAQARPSINMERAERTVQTMIDREMIDHNTNIAGQPAPTREEIDVAASDGFELSAPSFIMSVAAECDQDGNYRALCDVEYNFDDGYTDEQTVIVTVTLHGKYRTTFL